MRILIVEDEPGVARFLDQASREAGYTTEVVGDGQAALQRASAEPFDLILLDVMLPGMDGLAVCRQLRGASIHTPILIITAKDTEADKVLGLDSGADDYIVKPFKLGELLARMRALLRRSAYQPSMLRIGDLTLNPVLRQATRATRTIYLSATEYCLLEYLARHAGQTLTRLDILNHVWQYDFGGNDNVLDVYISYLRAKIDKWHKTPLIHTVRGVGFCLKE
jgi:DNA-binding response OmpR family regulator